MYKHAATVAFHSVYLQNQTCFKPGGETVLQELVTFLSSRAKNKLCGMSGRTNFLPTILFLCCL